MKVELLVIPECPGAERAAELLRRALDDIGLADVAFSTSVIETDDAARAHEFAGSPSFLVDGVDLFSSDVTGGSIACRVYPTSDGPRNVPALRDLREALRKRTAPTARR